MKPGEPVYRSPLDKPLSELTEEDISQLTREDCRKYLKDKGMRRPSWNKSQAIQQVISLKTLLESRPDSGDAAAVIRQKIAAPEPENPPHIDPAPADESASDRSKDALQQSSGSGEAQAPCHTPAAGKGPFPLDSSISPRAAASEGSFGQLTIFYDGKVNVYEGVPPDKARMIMQLAGSPNNNGCLPCDVTTTASTASPLSRTMPSCVRMGAAASSPPLPVVTSSTNVQAQQQGKTGQYSQEGIEEGKVSRESEGPASRKACLQRYLEKRKDRVRFKHKKKIGGSSSSSLEMYINQQARTQSSNGQLSRSGTSSPTQPKPPHTPTRCSSVENLPKNLCLSVDLNDDGPEDGVQD
ncbi:hypothetical protein AAC387_Pa01g2500 [Persea americana]